MLIEMGWEILPHPPYSPDIAPSDYPLCSALQFHMSEKSFDDVCQLLLRLGFQSRRGSGSHTIFHRDGIPEILNLQPRDGKGKPYQMKQVRDLILRHHLTADEP